MSGYIRDGIAYNSQDEANLAAAIPSVYYGTQLDAGYIAEAILDSDWLAQHEAWLLRKYADFIREKEESGEWLHLSTAALYLYEESERIAAVRGREQEVK